MSHEEEYDEKVELIKKCANHEKTSRIPVISFIQTWAISYAKTTAREAFASMDKEFETYAKPLNDIYFDGTVLFSMNRPIPMYESLGYSPYFYSNDGTTIQHSDNKLLPAEDIDEYAANPKLYIRNKMLYRRYPALQQDFPKDLEALGSAMQLMMAHKAKLDAIPDYLRSNVGTPTITGDTFEPALDRYIGYRSFAEGMTDLRRRPEQALEAIEATYPIVAPTPAPQADFPFAFFPVVTVTYLNQKNFEKFFWPTAKRTIDTIISNGGKVMIFLEGSWAHVYECLLDFPKGSIIACLEGDDMIQAKKVLGDKVCLLGGLPIDLLKNGTPEQNIDRVKSIIDGCGDTTGIMFTAEKALLSPHDAKAENLRAVSEYLRDLRV